MKRRLATCVALATLSTGSPAQATPLQPGEATPDSAYLQIHHLHLELRARTRSAASLWQRVVRLERRVARLRSSLASIRTVASASPMPTPTTAAPTASPPAATPWAALAECESGGDWSIDHGIGPDVSGGLQIARETWQAEGGLAYAPEAYQASPGEQIAIGERILRDQGIGAWPTCGPRVGL